MYAAGWLVGCMTAGGRAGGRGGELMSVDGVGPFAWASLTLHSTYVCLVEAARGMWLRNFWRLVRDKEDGRWGVMVGLLVVGCKWS